MSLTWPPTLAEAKTNENISSTADDAELQAFLDRAVAILENLPGYTVKDHVKQTTYTEWHAGGQDVIVLKHYPVISVTSVAEYTPTVQALAAEPLDTTTDFTGYGYSIDLASGMLSRTSGGSAYNFSGRVKIVYVAGVTTVSADLWGAALDLTAHLWETQRGDQGPSVEGLDDTVAGFTDDRLLPSRIREVLLPYRKAPAVA